MQENRYKRLASDIIIFIIGTVLAKAIQFILMPLYTTYMTTEAYGVAELTNNLSELFFPIATLCIYEGAFRFAVDPDFDNSHLATAVTKVMTKSVLIGLVLALVCRLIFNYQYAFYLYFILYAYSIRMCAAYYVRGIGYSKVFAMSGVVNALALSFFNFIFLVLLKTSEDGYLLSIGLSYCASALYLVWRGKIASKISLKTNSASDLKILFKYCVPLIFYNVLYWFTTISGRYILLWFTDSSTAGKYVAAIKIAAVINMVQQAVYAAFQLNSSRAFTEDNKEKYYAEITNIFISLYCTFGAVIVCCTPILAKFTLRNDFYDARIYLPAIMLGAIITCISSLLGTMYSTYKKTQLMVGVSVVGAGINIAVGLALTPIMGVWGICIASICCYSSQVVYKFIDVQKFCKIKYNWGIIISNISLLTIQVLIMSVNAKFAIIESIIIAMLLLIINLKSMLCAKKQFIGKN